jgi:hypothetical protein
VPDTAAATVGLFSSTMNFDDMVDLKPKAKSKTK